MSDRLEDLRAYIRCQVAEGFESLHEIVEDAVAYAWESLGLENAESEVKRLTAEVVAEHLREQGSWLGETDCEKIDRAFVEPVSEPSGESCRRPFSSRSMRFINWKSGL